jgi:hypothetical protein
MDAIDHLLYERDEFLTGRSRNVFSRRSRSPNATTVPTTVTWSLPWMTGSVYVSSIA